MSNENFEIHNILGPVNGFEVCKEASGGKNTDILVPHPTDCTKFFNCQAVKQFKGQWNWIGKHFIISLQVGNYVRNIF